VRLPNNDVILTEPYEIQERLGHLVEIVVDSGIILPFPSTVVDLTRDVPNFKGRESAEALKSL
jgi:tRNA A37 threonylcarbamoyladenosine synthetase subunit TsaC/SUA5/YrdC